MTTQASDAIIRMVDIVKDFPGVRALNRVNFHARKGEVLALVGENGAGKSTLMKVLSGVWPYPTYQGDIFIKGERVRFQGTKDAEEAGVAIIHQELNLIPELTIGENIFMNRWPRNKLGMVDWQRLYRDADEALSSFGIALNPATPIRELTVGKQQTVEIAKALSIKAEILILDEPTSALSDREVADLFNVIRRLKAQGGCMIYISNKMDELRQIADSVTVLRDGQSVSDVIPIRDLSDDDIIAKMVGRQVGTIYPKRTKAKGEAVMTVEHFEVDHPLLVGEKKVDDVSFTVHKGEILGITGLMGSGRTELVEGIFGAFPKDARGKVFLEGRPLSIAHPKDAIKAGIALVTEDRKLLGLVGGMSVRENATLAILDNLRRNLVVDRLEENKVVAEMIGALRIKTASQEVPVKNLSGGNQQKVVLAKWLLAKPKVLILDEPTRGVDVGAKVEIYQLVSDLAEKGVAIVMISSELPEILGMSDRIVVMCEGKLVAELDRAEATQERIMRFATLGRAAA